MNLSVKRLFDIIIVWKNWKQGKLNGKDTGLYLDCSNAPRWSKLCIACSDFFCNSKSSLILWTLAPTRIRFRSIPGWHSFILYVLDFALR